jgi:hypothetical protein
VSLRNTHAKQPVTVAIRRLRIEIAGAPEGAVAVLHPIAFKTPICVGHYDAPP